MKVIDLLKKIKIDRRRLIAGVLFLVLELGFFFGSGALLEEEVHFLSGEGAWTVELSDEAPSIVQEFRPTHKHLDSISFCMDLTGITQLDSEVNLAIEDENGQVLFEKSMDIQDITDGAYTDVKLGLEVSLFKNYFMKITATPTSAGEYPAINVCSTDYELEESRSLSHESVLEKSHLVSRYSYVDALTVDRALKMILLCMVAFVGVVVGLPENNYARKAIGVVLMIAAPYVLGQRLELLSHNSWVYLPIAMKWNLGIMYALEILVLLVTHSTAVSVVLTNVALTILYSANFFTLMYRGTSLRVSDFTAIGTAADVIGEFDLTPNSHMAMAWAILIVFVVFGAQTVSVKKKKEEAAAKEPKRMALRVLSYVVTIAIAVGSAIYGGHTLLYTDFLQKQGFMGDDITGFLFEMTYTYNGYLVGTCVEIQRSRIEMPEGYSVERVEEILGSVEVESTEVELEEHPHVILIMNESLTDVSVLGDVETNQEYMPFLRSMEENTIKGYANTSVYGGGTANSEFEVFTGCNVSFLPVNYYPYQQALRRPTNSMVSSMSEYGYTTIAMHPESPSNWSRQTIYKNFGFDQIYFEKDFEGAEKIHSGVSDAETYNKVIELYESRDAGEKLFIFDLTMQNHGGYEQSKAPDEVQALDFDEPQINEFLSLIKISDSAFQDLVEYFEKQDEKVIICMFGDHQPWITDLLVSDDMTSGNAASERMMDKYRTPFVIWANYDIEEQSGCETSLNYLGGMVMRTAGLPLSPYFTYLEDLSREYPIITINGYRDSEGNYYSWSSYDGQFEDYQFIQYNYLFDENTVEWGY